ncbi:hypothetical protein AURDEDRAFT_175323 [Auricularia subglabra TFB-10046 SS5]|nr:hypothetical protein AURDEDRAFT_175323 [Auricularia subglabra TFB-10046 SS5]
MSTGLPLAPTLPARRTEEPAGTDEASSMTSTHADKSTNDPSSTSATMRDHTVEFDKPPQRSHTDSANSAAGKAAGGIGDRIRGTFDVVHGAGEVLRGNVQNALDSFGDSITARDKNSVPSRTQGGNPEVAAKGVQEYQNGLDKVMGRTPRHGSAA